MKFRIRRIDSRDYGNSIIASTHDYVHVVEQEVMKRKFIFFGKRVPVWVRVASGIALAVAENELLKIMKGPREHSKPVTVKELEV